MIPTANPIQKVSQAAVKDGTVVHKSKKHGCFPINTVLDFPGMDHPWPMRFQEIPVVTIRQKRIKEDTWVSDEKRKKRAEMLSTK